MQELVREVSSTVEEFRRGLYQAFPGNVSGDGLRYSVAMDAAAMDIELTHLPDRIIALLRLPALGVHIRFTRGDADECRRLLEHLDRVTHRGGG
jgi:hypothetical protein